MRINANKISRPDDIKDLFYSDDNPPVVYNIYNDVWSRIRFGYTFLIFNQLIEDINHD